MRTEWERGQIWSRVAEVAFDPSSVKNSPQGGKRGSGEALRRQLLAAPCSSSLRTALGHAACLLADPQGLLLSQGE